MARVFFSLDAPVVWEKRFIETNVALASIAFVLIGFFLISTGVTLYAISRFAKKTRAKR